MDDSISTCVTTAFDSFKVLSRALSNTHEQHQGSSLAVAFADNNCRFKVWCGNVGAHQLGKSSLDYRLRKSDRIKQIVLKSLAYLTRLSSEATEIATGVREPCEYGSDDSESELDEDSRESPRRTEVEQIMYDIGQTIESLYRISMAIQDGSPKNRYAKCSAIDVSYFEPHDVRYVREKFPSAAGFLVDRLGKSISQRRRYLKYRETHAAKLLKTLDSSTSDTESILSETTATTFEDDFNSSGMRRRMSTISLATETSYATSAENENGSRMPQIPGEALLNRPFECPFCHKIVSVCDTRAWRKHVYNDLQPYVCTFERCIMSGKTFETRHEWFNHELQKHRLFWTCPGHCSMNFRSRNDFEAHVRQHRPGTITGVELDLLTASAATPLDRIDAESLCPLCNSDGHHLKTAQMKKHLGRHLQELSLFALPQIDVEPESEDLIFCHACSHEWRRPQHGLQCPKCWSDVVEVVSF